jgi:hypothetical protein
LTVIFFVILSGSSCLEQRDGKDSFPEFRLDLVAVDFAGYAYGSGFWQKEPKERSE